MPLLNPRLLSLSAENEERWRPGQTMTTPGTRLTWRCLAGWVRAWETLQRRRVSGNRPRKGEREGHWTTRMIVAAGNRLARLGAVPYREHRRQQSRRRKLRQIACAEPARSTFEDTRAPHLSLF